VSAHHDIHTPTRDELVRATAAPIPRAYTLASAAMAIIGLVIFLVGVFTGNERAWHAYLVNWLYFTSISSAGVVFVAIQRLATARWSRPVVRMLEGYVAFLPVALVMMLVMLIPGPREHIFTWAKETVTVHEKAVYLDPTFFTIRGPLILGVYTLLSIWYIYSSVRLDVGVTPESGSKWAAGLRARMRRGFGDERRELHSTHSMQGKLAVAICMLFGFGWCVLAWDYSMTLSLHFQSTMYAWIEFMSGFVVMLMTWSLLVMWWKNHLRADDLITENHFHDLGKLCFAFTAFIGYLSFSQFLVIWYGNLPEETHFYRLRFGWVWQPLTTAVMFLMFFLPFLGLISKAAKLKLPVFAFFAICSSVGLWLHRYLEVYPSVYGEATTLPLGIWELALFIGFLGTWGLCYIGFMNAFPKMRIFLMTSPYRDEVQVPVDPKTMEPLPAHE
jgi:hypothetical protein